MKYYYTSYGDVISGEDFSTPSKPGQKIIIQNNKKKAYLDLPHEQAKNDEKIAEFGYCLNEDLIEKILDDGAFARPNGTKVTSDSWAGDFKRNHLFIFGAGASANCIFGNQIDSFKKDPLRPPLGPGLFEDRFKSFYDRFDGVKRSLHLLQSAQNPNVEALFEEEWNSIQKHNNRNVLARHINIQYYLQEVLSKTTRNVLENYTLNLYTILVDKIQKAYQASIKVHYGQRSSLQFGFISFNQDTILDQLLFDYFGKDLTNLWDYVNINESPFVLFKPHGSWNWGWKFPNISNFGKNTSKWLFDNKVNFYELYFKHLGNHLEMVDWDGWGYHLAASKHSVGKHTIDKGKLGLIPMDDFNSFFPALLLPYRDKDEFTMPNRHLFRMESYMARVETLVIIGWKGNEESFNRKLVAHTRQLRKVIIVDPACDHVKENLKPLIEKPSITVTTYNDFEDFIKNGLEKEIGVD